MHKNLIVNYRLHIIVSCSGYLYFIHELSPIGYIEIAFDNLRGCQNKNDFMTPSAVDARHIWLSFVIRRTVEDKFIHLEIGEIWCPDTNQNDKIWI